MNHISDGRRSPNIAYFCLSYKLFNVHTVLEDITDQRKLFYSTDILLNGHTVQQTCCSRDLRFNGDTVLKGYRVQWPLFNGKTVQWSCCSTDILFCRDIQLDGDTVQQIYKYSSDTNSTWLRLLIGWTVLFDQPTYGSIKILMLNIGWTIDLLILLKNS